MQNEKTYLNIDEQIELLLSKGITIRSEKLAKKYLTDIGYYKLVNGYREPFIAQAGTAKGDVCNFFHKGTDVEDLYNLYKFDQDLKGLIFKNISYVETMVKARMSDHISRVYGIKENDYLRSTNFKPDTNNPKDTKFIKIHQNILESITKQYKKHNSITWYADNYGYYPFWVVSNILTLGTISLLYSKMRQEDQYAISKTFGVKSKLFESMLMILLLFRNKCAHNEIVYNFKTDHRLSQKEIEYIFEMYKIPKNEKTGRYIKGTNDVFALIIVFKFLLDKSQFSEFIAQLNSLLNTLEKKIGQNAYMRILVMMGIMEDLELIKNYQIK